MFFVERFRVIVEEGCDEGRLNAIFSGVVLKEAFTHASINELGLVDRGNMIGGWDCFFIKSVWQHDMYKI